MVSHTVDNEQTAMEGMVVGLGEKELVVDDRASEVIFAYALDQYNGNEEGIQEHSASLKEVVRLFVKQVANCEKGDAVDHVLETYQRILLDLHGSIEVLLTNVQRAGRAKEALVTFRGVLVESLWQPVMDLGEEIHSELNQESEKQVKCRSRIEEERERFSVVFAEEGAVGVIECLNSFTELTHVAIAKELIDRERCSAVATHIAQFNPATHPTIAHEIISKGKGWLVVTHLDSFKGLDHAKVANNLFNQGCGRLVAQHLNSFKGLTHQTVVDKLIATKEVGALITNLSQLEGINHQEIVNALFENGDGECVAIHLNQFEDVNHTAIARDLITEGKSQVVVDTLPLFFELDREVADTLAARGFEQEVTENQSSFCEPVHVAVDEGAHQQRVDSTSSPAEGGPGYFSKEYALSFLDSGRGAFVMEHLSQFHGLDQEVMNAFIAMGEGQFVVQQISSFENIDLRETAFRLVDAGMGWYIAENISQFEGVSHCELVRKLIDAEETSLVTKHFSHFTDLDQKVAEALIAVGEELLVIENLSQFTITDHDTFMVTLIGAGLDSASLQHGLLYYKSFGESVADALIDAGKGDLVLNNLPLFHTLNRHATAKKLLAMGKVRLVVAHLSRLGDLDQEIAEDLVAAGEAPTVIQNLSRFGTFDHHSFVSTLLDANLDAALVQTYLDHFTGFDRRVAKTLIEAGMGEYVADHLNACAGLDQEVADKLFAMKRYDSVAENLDCFTRLDRETAEKLIDEGFSQKVAQHPSLFHDPTKDAHHSLNKGQIVSLLRRGESAHVIDNIATCRGLDQEVAEALIDAGEGWFVGKNLSQFTNLDYRTVISKLIDAGKGDVALTHFSLLDTADHSGFAAHLIDTGKENLVVENLNHYHDLDKAVASSLIEAGFGQVVNDHISSFASKGHSVIAEKLLADTATDVAVIEDVFSRYEDIDAFHIAQVLIATGRGSLVIAHLSSFDERDRGALAEELLTTGGEGAVSFIQNLNSFSNLDGGLARHIAAVKGKGVTGWKAVLQHLSVFKAKDLPIVATSLASMGYTKEVAARLADFTHLGTALAKNLIEKSEGEAVAHNLSSFHKLHQEVADALVDEGFGSAVADHVNSFDNLVQRVTVDANDMTWLDHIPGTALVRFQAESGTVVEQCSIAALRRWFFDSSLSTLFHSLLVSGSDVTYCEDGGVISAVEVTLTEHVTGNDMPAIQLSDETVGQLFHTSGGEGQEEAVASVLTMSFIGCMGNTTVRDSIIPYIVKSIAAKEKGEALVSLLQRVERLILEDDGSRAALVGKRSGTFALLGKGEKELVSVAVGR